MSLRNIDLNLLVILDAVLSEQNVSRAAEKLGLTQSAVSHALRRLRAEFKDELLVRNGRQMALTWKASQIRDGLHAALSQIEEVVGDKAGFDPGRSSRTFALRVSDYVSDYLLADLCHALRLHAPGLRLQVEHFRGDVPDILGDEIHVRLASEGERSSKLRYVRVVDDEFAVILGRRHPAADEIMTLELYLSLAHLKVAASAIGGNMIDDALRRRGLSREIVLRLPGWADVGSIVEASDIVAVVPRHWAARPSLRRRCRSKPLPIEEVRFAIDVIWDRRFDEDTGHMWMRSLVIDSMQKQTYG